MVEHKLPYKTMILWQIRLVIIGLIFLGLFTYLCRFFSWYLPVFLSITAFFLVLLIWYIPALFKTY